MGLCSNRVRKGHCSPGCCFTNLSLLQADSNDPFPLHSAMEAAIEFSEFFPAIIGWFVYIEAIAASLCNR